MKSRYMLYMFLLIILIGCESAAESAMKTENERYQKRILELEQELIELRSSQPQKKPALDYYIDGTPLYLFKEDYFLEYDGKTFVSTDFVNTFYGAEYNYPSNITFRGLPIENKLYQIDSVLELTKDGVKGIISQMKVKEQDEYMIIYETDGMEVSFYESGIATR